MLPKILLSCVYASEDVTQMRYQLFKGEIVIRFVEQSVRIAYST